MNISNTSIPILDTVIPICKYIPIDLSIYNKDLTSIHISNPNECQDYITKRLEKKNAAVAFGGYLEQRNIYADKINFSKTTRDIHIGMDFWASVNTKVIVPIGGRVHSYKNNSSKGDYGPTIILEHKVSSISFYSLYGHLSLDSLEGLYIGKEFMKGDYLGALGETAVNVNYAPHLHFQIIKDIKDYKGDYPGVCAAKDLKYYKNNCPNPNLLLKL